MSEKEIKKRVSEYIKRLKSDNLEEKREAAWELQHLEMKAKDAIPTLVEAIKDKDWAVRSMSVLALGKLKYDEVNPDLIHILLNDESEEVRSSAAEALVRIRPSDINSLLVQAIKDKHKLVRERVVWGLGVIGEEAKEAIPEIIALLKKPDEGLIHSIAAWALVELGAIEGIEQLTETMLMTESDLIRFRLALSLAYLEESEGEGLKEVRKMKDQGRLSPLEESQFEDFLSFRSYK
ncbi:MAG: HEAT repeat domain-containing protein [Candidatus Heimdallarchaeota archaeon]|nr:HEAT repeat domain-containing protein [Candidatus Heimdallarchaeota archaeon]